MGSDPSKERIIGDIRRVQRRLGRYDKKQDSKFRTLELAVAYIQGCRYSRHGSFDDLPTFPPIYKLNVATLKKPFQHIIQFTPPVRDNGKVRFRFLDEEDLNLYGDRGRLPKGVSLSSDGVVSGTPQESGIFQVCVLAHPSDDYSMQVSREFLLEVVSK